MSSASGFMLSKNALALDVRTAVALDVSLPVVVVAIVSVRVCLLRGNEMEKNEGLSVASAWCLVQCGKQTRHSMSKVVVVVVAYVNMLMVQVWRHSHLLVTN